MRKDQDSAVEALVEQLIEGGSENMATVFAGLFNLAMRIERERFLGAGHYERTPERRGYANGTRPKKIDTPAGTVRLEVPKTAGHEAPFYPQALERGRRSCRARSCWPWRRCRIKGVSTRDAEAVMREFRPGEQIVERGQPRRQALGWGAGCLAQPAAGRDPLTCATTRAMGKADFEVRVAAALSPVIGLGPDSDRRVLVLSCATRSARSQVERLHWSTQVAHRVARCRLYRFQDHLFASAPVTQGRGSAPPSLCSRWSVPIWLNVSMPSRR